MKKFDTNEIARAKYSGDTSKKILAKDIVIPAGTIFGAAPVRTILSEGHYEATIGLSPNTAGSFTYYVDDEVSEYFSDYTGDTQAPESPGEHLKRKLEDSNETAYKLATAAGLSRSTISAVINHDRSITVDTAYRLASFFADTTPRYWLVLQMEYDLKMAQAS